MVGIELVKNAATKERFDARLRVGALLCQRIRKHGVVLRPLGDVIVIMPPLAMGTDDLEVIIRSVESEVSLLPSVLAELSL